MKAYLRTDKYLVLGPGRIVSPERELYHSPRPVFGTRPKVGEIDSSCIEHP